jgi:Ni/Fe-hydrogenase subunit HybB-like protein
MTVLAGALWRVDAFLTCYNAGESWTYWPSWGEISVTVGMASFGVAVFIVVSRLLPVVEVQDTAVPASIAAFVLTNAPHAAASGKGGIDPEAS